MRGEGEHHEIWSCLVVCEKRGEEEEQRISSPFQGTKSPASFLSLKHTSRLTSSSSLEPLLFSPLISYSFLFVTENSFSLFLMITPVSEVFGSRHRLISSRQEVSSSHRLSSLSQLFFVATNLWPNSR